MSYTAICYAYSAVLLLVCGGLAWLTNRRGVVNRLFLLLCVLLSLGACATSFMHATSSITSCLYWNRLTWIGWCFYPPVFVLVMLVLTGYTRPLQRYWGWVSLFVPAVVLFIRSQSGLFDIDGFTPTAHGTFTPHYTYHAWAMAYYIFERLCLLLGLAVLWWWGRQSHLRRQKLQVRAIIICILIPVATSMLAYLFGPDGEFDAIIALGLCLPALGICYAIVRYQFVVPLTTLAAGHVLTSVKDMVLLTTESGDIIQVNRSAEALLGFSEQELLGQHITWLLATDTPDHAAWPPGTVPSELPWLHTTALITAAGEQIPAQVTCSRMADQYGDTIGLVVIAEDLRQTRQLEREITERTAAEHALQRLNEDLEERIAHRTIDLALSNQEYYAELQERRRTEQALRESEARYRTLFENAGDGIYIIDLALQLIAVNEKSCERLGYTREELQHLTPTQLLPPDMLTNMPAILQEITANGHAVYETVHLHKDGCPLYMELNSCLIEYEGKTAIMTIARDLTERKRREEQERMLQQLQETSSLRTEFFSYISHELKTPLTPIIGGVSLLVSGDVGRVQQEQFTVLAMIDRQARRLLRLIEDLLDLLCMEQGHLSLLTQQVQLPVLIRDSIAVYAERFHTQGLTLQFFAPEGALPPIAGDTQRIGQIIDNLLSNALKYTDCGGAVVQCDRYGSMLRVRIRDTGIGMTTDKSQRIFEPFYQVDTHQPGAGLGLAIVKQLVEAHGGTITVDSGGPGLGTCFTILFPVMSEETADRIAG